jgi:hypothetical protein
MRQRLQSGRYSRSYFETARIHIGPKIHGVLLIASTQFMRKRAMDVYMENYKKANSADNAETHRYKRPAEGLERLHELRHGRRWRLRFFSRSSSSFLWRSATKMAKQLARPVGGATAEMG